MVEVKTTSIKDESKYLIAKAKLDDYGEYWSETVLVIYCLRSGNLYCRRIGDIDRSQLGNKAEFGKRMYELNLMEDFLGLPDVFKLLEASKYSQYCLSIRQVLKEFG